MMASGMDIKTGRIISGVAYLMQSIRLRLETPKFTRLIERLYGSEIFYAIDQSVTESIEIFRAAAEALVDLKEFRLTKTTIRSLEAGSIEVGILGVYLPTGEELNLGVRI